MLFVAEGGETGAEVSQGWCHKVQALQTSQNFCLVPPNTVVTQRTPGNRWRCNIVSTVTGLIDDEARYPAGDYRYVSHADEFSVCSLEAPLP